MNTLFAGSPTGIPRKSIESGKADFYKGPSSHVKLLTAAGLTLATRVLPFPGGPVSSIPQCRAPLDRYECGYFIGHWMTQHHHHQTVKKSSHL